MASTAAHEHHSAQEKFWVVEHDPAGGSTDAVVVDLGQPQGASEKCISLTANGGLQSFRVICQKAVGTGNTNEFSIIAATDATGTGATVVQQIATATAQTQNAINDNLFIEVTAEQIREVLSTATHVGVRHQAATGTDEWQFACIAQYLHRYAGLTANYIS